MTTFQTIAQEFAHLTWCLVWSDHVEDHRCYNLSGCQIDDHAPDMPQQALPMAIAAIIKVESKLLAHAPLQAAVQEALAWLQEFSEPADHKHIIHECEGSPICAALLVAARAEATASQDDITREFEEPTVEAMVLYEDDIFVKRFADCLAYQLVGAGVSWSDDHEEIPFPDMYDTSFFDTLRGYAEDCKEKPIRRHR